MTMTVTENKTSVKYNETLGEYRCNVVFTSSDVDKELIYYLNSFGITKTSCYYSYAQWSYKLSDSNPLGLQVYKDYFTCLSLVYMGNNGEYHSIGLGEIMNNNMDSMYIHNLPNFINLPQDRYTKAEAELVRLIKGHTEIMHDYDREQIEDAISSGDFELAEDILGDRDITEFI